jgi:prephenate dehydratase/chorismate mutase/prephenate dehydratase
MGREEEVLDVGYPGDGKVSHIDGDGVVRGDFPLERESAADKGARIASEEGDGTYAAICSAGCAEVYGLEILARDIQQNSANVTRFYVLTKDAPANGAGDRMVFVAEGPSSALPSLMSRIDELGMTLVSCHDRPAKTELGRYRYLIEVAGPKAGSFKALSTVPGFSWRNLGTFSLR